jgi:hypothetical protein
MELTWENKNIELEQVKVFVNDFEQNTKSITDSIPSDYTAEISATVINNNLICKNIKLTFVFIYS